jgi:hypothetical protein
MGSARYFASLTISSMLHPCDATPAAIAGVTRSVLWTRTLAHHYRCRFRKLACAVAREFVFVFYLHRERFGLLVRLPLFLRK